MAKSPRSPASLEPAATALWGPLVTRVAAAAETANRGRLISAGRVFHYRAYGLAISSDTRMPELSASGEDGAEACTQVRVTLRARTSRPYEPKEWLNVGTDDLGKPWFKSARVVGGYLLRYPGLADFFVAGDGREIRCLRVASNITSLTLRHLLLDQAFPRLLSLLGHEALHATAVAAPAGVCAFIGAAGTGKSTLAASFQLEGFSSVCDDCLVVDEREGQIFATPGYPGVRLWRDSLAAIAGADAQTAPVADYTSKARLLGAQTSQRFVAEARPLARIYFLTREEAREAPGIEPISPAEIFPHLIGSSF